jgi:hypothetical protein
VLYGIQVSGDLDFDWATLHGVSGDAMSIGRHLYLQGTRCTGDLEFTGTRIAGSLYGRQGRVVLATARRGVVAVVRAAHGRGRLAVQPVVSPA